MLVVEIFDSKLQLKWERKWSFRMTQFQWGENTYVIQLGTLELPGFAGKTIAEVSFHRKDIVGDKAFATVGASENPVKVYGVILNALHDVFSEYDVFYFTAEKRHSETPEERESKVKIYRFLANRIQKWTGAYYYEATNNRTHEFIVSKTEVNSSKWKNPLAEAVALLPTANIPRI